MQGLANFLTQITGKWNACILVVVISFAAVISIPNALAQSGAGSIQGTVTDPTGAVIPGASIHVVNQATNPNRRSPGFAGAAVEV